jgi:hypothetical protein
MESDSVTFPSDTCGPHISDSMSLGMSPGNVTESESIWHMYGMLDHEWM